MKILITGACGFLGHQLVEKLKKMRADNQEIIIYGTDVKASSNFELDRQTHYEKLDVRSKTVADIFENKQIDVVVHLATIVTPGRKMDKNLQYEVDVDGTENVLAACVKYGVKKVIVTSSGAAYGYYKDNPDWLNEDDAIRGNQAFAYAYHKRLVENILESYREKHPELKQLIFRIGTILGESVDNQITNLFEKNRLIGIRGSDSPFVFIWDEDVITCLSEGVLENKSGIYNLAGDGAIGIDDMAQILNKKVIRFPALFLKSILFVLKRLYMTQYGEEQVNFIRYRPVLDNHRLKEIFGFQPTYSSQEVFEKIAGFKSTWHKK